MRNAMNRRVAIGLMSFAGLNATLNSYGLAQDINTRPKEEAKYPLVIFFQAGAQSPYEFTSPLTDSPENIRGPFSWSTTEKNKIAISDAFPEYASVADETSIIRSVNCENVSHELGPILGDSMHRHARNLTGEGVPYSIFRVDPSYSIKAPLMAAHAFVSEYKAKKRGYTPPKVSGKKEVRRRRDLLRSLESQVVEDNSVLDFMGNRDLAFELLVGGGKIKKLFKVSEDQLKRYGNSHIGNAAAIATNLAREGAGIVFLYNRYETETGTGWDMHDDIEKRTKEGAHLTDKALKASIEDGREYGFVTVATTEHGRTPFINLKAGRDHSTVGYLIGSGGNFRRGTVFGELDRKGEIKSDIVSAKRVLPTILTGCGIENDAFEIPVKEVLV